MPHRTRKRPIHLLIQWLLVAGTTFTLPQATIYEVEADDTKPHEIRKLLEVRSSRDSSTVPPAWIPFPETLACSRPAPVRAPDLPEHRLRDRRQGDGLTLRL